MQCGVGQFTARLAEAIGTLDPGGTATLTLTRKQGSLAEIWRAISSAQNIVCNFPIVAWKRVIFAPLIALLIARLRGRRVILIQHEWRSLHPLRRVTYLPALLLADRIIMFSPLVRNELAADSLVGWTAMKCVLAPLPPNLKAPPGIADSKLRQRLAAARGEGRLVIGHFGSIYPGKQPNALLDICAALKQRGLKPLVAYIGSFIRGMDKVEDDFRARAAALGVTDDVVVSGYVASDRELFGLFGEVDVFLLPARRRADRAARQHFGRRAVRPASHRHGACRSGRVRTSSAVQGVDRAWCDRAGAPRRRRRHLCGRDRRSDEASDAAVGIRFRRLVARCREIDRGSAHSPIRNRAR